MARYEVASAAVQVVAGARAHFVERGATLPEGVEEDVLERLLAEGLIAQIDEAEEPETVEVPEGNPTDDWSNKQLDAYAAAHAIDVKAAKNKAEKLAAFAAASA